MRHLTVTAEDLAALDRFRCRFPEVTRCEGGRVWWAHACAVRVSEGDERRAAEGWAAFAGREGRRSE